MLRSLLLIAYYGFFGALVLIGLHGLLTPAWELAPGTDAYAGHVFDRLADQARTDALNQYRYLKTGTLLTGFFGLVFRREVVTVPKVGRFLVAMLLLGAAARLLSLVLDGRPSPFYLMIAAFEVIGVLIVLAYRRYAPAPLRPEAGPG